MNKFLFFIVVFGFYSNMIFSQNLTAFVENSSDNKPIPSVHVINLSQVVGVITDVKGKFEIPAKLNDTLYLSYLGFKSIKVRVTNDLLKFENSKIQLTELAYALEEVIVKPYELTGYLEIDAKNVPVSQSYRYSIPGLPSRGYEEDLGIQVHFRKLLMLFLIQQIFFIIYLANSLDSLKN